MKKTLSYLVAGALALSLTACSNPLDEDKNSITVYAGRSESLVQPLIDSFQEETGIPVIIAEDPLTCVARGCGKTLDQLDYFKNTFVYE